jgi:HEAT repeat protein
MLTEAIRNPDDDDESRVQSAVGLGKIATPTAIDTLLKALDDSDLKLRSAASASLARAGRPNSAAAPVGMTLSKCIAALASGSENVKIGVAQALQGIAAPQANAALLAIANNTKNTESLRSAAILALGFPNNGGAVPALVSLLGEKDTEAPGNAARDALAAIGASAIPALIARLPQNDDTLSFRAATALARMGAIALPALQQAAQGSNTGAQRWAAVALGEMGIAEAKPILQQLAKSSDADVAYVANEQLYRNGRLQ